MHKAPDETDRVDAAITEAVLSHAAAHEQERRTLTGVLANALTVTPGRDEGAARLVALLHSLELTAADPASLHETAL